MHTALVLDIDGVVRPASGFSPFGDLVEVGVALRAVRVPPALCAALTDLAALPRVTPVWLTSWLPEMRQAMRPPFPGRDWEQLDLGHGVPDAWPKWSALTAWLARNPQITRVAWVDDDLSHSVRPDPQGGDPAPSRARCYTEELGRRALDALMIAPATDYGMTPGHIAHLERWIGGDHAASAR